VNASRLRAWVLLLAVCVLLAIACVPAPCIVLQPGWPQTAEGPVASSLALGDLDDDGHLEIIVGSADHHV
jgi:hypothetical protein